MAGLFRNRWWVVFATICGLLAGAGPINVFTLWRVSEADYRRSRAEPRGVFCGVDISRGDRRDRPSAHRLAG
jgi:hypothetical protein